MARRISLVLTPPQRRTGPLANITGKVLEFLMAFVVGMLAILIAPRKLEIAADSIRRRPWTNLGWGAIIMFATPIAAIIVMVTVISPPTSNRLNDESMCKTRMLNCHLVIRH